MTERQEWTKGSMIPVESEILSSMEIDCSSWASEVPVEKWTSGPVIPVEGEILPPLDIDCSTWRSRLTADLALTLQVAPCSLSMDDRLDYLDLFDVNKTEGRSELMRGLWNQYFPKAVLICHMDKKEHETPHETVSRAAALARMMVKTSIDNYPKMPRTNSFDADDFLDD